MLFFTVHQKLIISFIRSSFKVFTDVFFPWQSLSGRSLMLSGLQLLFIFPLPDLVYYSWNYNIHDTIHSLVQWKGWFSNTVLLSINSYWISLPRSKGWALSMRILRVGGAYINLMLFYWIGNFKWYKAFLGCWAKMHNPEGRLSPLFVWLWLRCIHLFWFTPLHPIC